MMSADPQLYFGTLICHNIGYYIPNFRHVKFWEAIVIFRKLIIVLFAVTMSSVVQLMWGILLITFSAAESTFPDTILNAYFQ